MSAISALCAFSAVANAGLKCSGAISSKGGSPNGVDHLASSGLPRSAGRLAGAAGLVRMPAFLALLAAFAGFAAFDFCGPVRLAMRFVTGAGILSVIFIIPIRNSARRRQAWRRRTQKMGRRGPAL